MTISYSSAVQKHIFSFWALLAHYEIKFLT